MGRLCMSMACGMVLHLIKNPEVRSPGEVGVSNGRLRLELSDAESRFRVGGTGKGGFGRRRGSRPSKIVMVSLTWSVRMVHSVAASGHAALFDRSWQGVHTLS